jgi:hypothetical protein
MSRRTGGHGGQIRRAGLKPGDGETIQILLKR